MNYYFFPRIDGFDTRVTLANFPPVDFDGYTPVPEIAHAIWSDGKTWQVRALEEISPGDAMTFDDTAIGADDMSLAFLFLYPERLSETLDAPPVSARNATEPAWRGNISLSSATTSTSFQGEYPSAMCNIQSGSLLSIAPMVQHSHDMETLFLLVNMRCDPDWGQARLRFLNLADRKIVGETTARYNALSRVSLNEIESDGAIAIVSPEITGVPLYFTFDTDRRYLSLEHSHPPAESVVFGKRETVQNTMKGWWLGAAGWPS